MSDRKHSFLRTESPRVLLAFNAIMAITYFIAITFFFMPGNRILFGFLIAGEAFHLWQVLTFLYTVWDTRHIAPRNTLLRPSVDVYITAAGESIEIMEATVRAAKQMTYPSFKVYILNDGYVAGKKNWRDMETLAARLGVSCITRQIPGGAKAGNINHALSLTRSPLIAIFDADHVPHADFLAKTVPYFVDDKVAFVQTPQFYKNLEKSHLTNGSWEQQELFFGPICKGKNRLNSATLCGTNMVISRAALATVGGMKTDSIAEDFVTGLLMHARGYRSVYVPEVLAEGLATEDLRSYSTQQFRWARGAFDVIFRYNPLFMRGLTGAQRIQYLSSASFYLSGIVVMIDALLPIAFFYTGAVAVQMNSMLLAAIFLPYIFLTFYVIQRVSNAHFTFRSLGFSMGSFSIHTAAFFAALTGRKNDFLVTSKRALEGNFLPIVKWHLFYCALALVGIVVAYDREGVTASLLNNSMWALFNVTIFIPFIYASWPEKANAAVAVQRSAEEALRREDILSPGQLMQTQSSYAD
ncbi:glycosyltransferase [Candidatus Kaiserbacteria bacterium]|nr:glycosyltransferase [Candidatus Kaiserbacteria bacterium]